MTFVPFMFRPNLCNLATARNPSDEATHTSPAMRRVRAGTSPDRCSPFRICYAPRYRQRRDFRKSLAFHTASARGRSTLVITLKRQAQFLAALSLDGRRIRRILANKLQVPFLHDIDARVVRAVDDITRSLFSSVVDDGDLFREAGDFRCQIVDKIHPDLVGLYLLIRCSTAEGPTRAKPDCQPRGAGGLCVVDQLQQCLKSAAERRARAARTGAGTGASATTTTTSTRTRARTRAGGDIRHRFDRFVKKVPLRKVLTRTERHVRQSTDIGQVVVHHDIQTGTSAMRVQWPAARN